VLAIALLFLSIDDLDGFPDASFAATDKDEGKPPLRVFVLVGQSNMVGHGILSRVNETTGKQMNATLEWLVTNVPDEYGKLRQQEGQDETNVVDLIDSSGMAYDEMTYTKRDHKTQWTIRPDVLMACNSRKLDDLSPHATTYGNLYAGLCAGDPGQEDQQVGPELGFGWAVGDALSDGGDSPVMLLKIAWGGKSLAVDFRSPSSGGTTGPYYRSVIATIENTLSGMKDKSFPKKSGRPLQLSGFAWHQGWNDGCDDNMANEYEKNLANLIRDVRKDLDMPNLPFAVAGTGMVGYDKQQPHRRQEVVDAEMKVANYPEFKGNVASIDTRPFARGPAPASPTQQGYHWNGNVESYWLIGQSLGKAMVDLINQHEQKHPINAYSYVAYS